MSDISLSQAREIAIAELAKAEGGADGIALGDDVTESPSYFVVYYDTVEYWETKNPFVGLIGNAPILVPKNGGPIRRLSTGVPIDIQLERLENQA